MGVLLSATERVGKSESIEGQTNTVLILIFSWNCLQLEKYRISSTSSLS